MTDAELVNRIAALPEADPGEMVVPDPLVIALCVRISRRSRSWKVATLADFARVSVSSVERVERAEIVSLTVLQRVAQALGYERDAFVAARAAIGMEAAAARVEERWDNLVTVPVERLATQSIIRRIVAADGFLLVPGDLPETYAGDVEALSEWLDLASFQLAKRDGFVLDSDPLRLRRLYADVLAHVGRMERRGLTVLAGVIPSIGEAPIASVAVIQITARLADPGAPKHKTIQVDRSIVAAAIARSVAEFAV